MGVVEAGDNGTVEGNLVHEGDECVFNVGHIAVAVHVFAVEIGDNGEDGRKLEEGAIALIGLGDKILGLA